MILSLHLLLGLPMGLLPAGVPWATSGKNRGRDRGHNLSLIVVAVIKIELSKCRALFLRFTFFSVTIIHP